MADTDVYRVMYRNGSTSGWVQLTSNRHPHGLHTTLKSAKMCRSYHKWENVDLKIQKLGVRTYSQFKDGTEVIYRAETAWVDVDDS